MNAIRTLNDHRARQGFVIKGINHTGQIFLTRPSVSSCVRHGCHPLEKIPADLSDDWTFLIGHFIRLLDFLFDQAPTITTCKYHISKFVCTYDINFFFLLSWALHGTASIVYTVTDPHC